MKFWSIANINQFQIFYTKISFTFKHIFYVKKLTYLFENRVAERVMREGRSGRQIYQENDRIFHLLLFSPNDHNDMGWTRGSLESQLQTRILCRVLDPSSCTVFLCFPRLLVGNSFRSGGSRTQTTDPLGWWHARGSLANSASVQAPVWVLWSSVI